MPAATQMLDAPHMPIEAIPGLNRKLTGPDSLNAFFYTSPLLSQRLATLRNMVGGRSQLIVITGEHGSGKTTLMKQFMALSDTPWQRSRIRLKSRQRFSSRIWGRLNNRIIFVSKSDDLPSAIIDDAHQLSPQALKALLQWAFQPAERPRLQSILLLAAPQMRMRYDQIASYVPTHSVIDKIHMTPLTVEQTAAYLRHRMKHFRCSEAVSFSDKQIHTIHRTALGWPGRINHEAAILLKKKKAPLSGWRYRCRGWPFCKMKNGWAHWLRFQNLKRVLKLDPMPWVP